MRRLTSALALAIVLAATLFVAPTPARANGGACVRDWEECRDAATDAYFRDEVGTFRYSLMLDGCDISYGVCSIKA